MRSWPQERRAAWWASLTEAEQIALAYAWEFYARPNQLPPKWGWLIWLVMAGRGFGKTRCGAEYLQGLANASGPGARFFIAGRTAKDTRDVMVQGESGLEAIAPPWNRPVYKSSKACVVWPSGAIGYMYSAEVPDAPRGPQHHAGWADEIGAWDQYAKEFWDNLMFGLRLGKTPTAIATTTPRATRLIRYLVGHDGSRCPGTEGKWCHVTGGSTYDNMQNLPEFFRQQVLSQYEGTRLGRQEIFGELLTDVVGALWNPAWFELAGFRIGADSVPELPACVVGVDPAASSGESAAHTGIITSARGKDGDFYVLRDDSIRGRPDEWGRAAVHAYKDAFDGDAADHITAEANNGGEMVRHVISTVDPNVPVKLVHAARGKQTRAEPVSALYEQKRVHHVGHFAALEDEMTNWIPGKASPDRMDALVWSISDLMAHKPRARVDAGMVIESSPRKGGGY